MFRSLVRMILAAVVAVLAIGLVQLAPAMADNIYLQSSPAAVTSGAAAIWACVSVVIVLGIVIATAMILRSRRRRQQEEEFDRRRLMVIDEVKAFTEAVNVIKEQMRPGGLVTLAMTRAEMRSIWANDALRSASTLRDLRLVRTYLFDGRGFLEEIRGYLQNETIKSDAASSAVTLPFAVAGLPPANPLAAGVAARANRWSGADTIQLVYPLPQPSGLPDESDGNSFAAGR